MIYCFDLDGTLCSHQEDTHYENANPFMDRIEYVNKLYDEGNEIIIETARGSRLTKDIDWDRITKNQLDSWGVKYHQLRTGIKIAADLYVDDKAVHSELFFGGVL